MHSFKTSRARNRWYLLATVAIGVAICSCATEPETPAMKGLLGTIVSNDASLPNDPITVDSARVADDTLIAVVRYGGGCSDHTFQLVIGSAWMESFPVQVGARISHNANGDLCKALFMGTLHMSLRPLANAYRASYKQEHGTVAIQLAGTTKPLLFVF